MQVNLQLHPGQMEVFRSRARFKVIVAGRRWGKSMYSLIQIIRKASKPNSLVWYVAPTYPMAKDIMWPWLEQHIPPNWIVKKHDTKMYIKLRNGSRIVCKGADNPETLRGVGLDHVVMDEFQDMTPDTWKKVLRPTLITSGGDATFIGTPKSFNYLHEIYLLGQDPDLRRKGRWMSWQFRTADSPFVPPEEIEQARLDMDEKSFRQELEASFESMGGRVYYPFDRQVHVADLPFNPDLPIWVGQDFNNSPMSSVILQPQENGQVWAVDEIVLKGASTEDAVSELEKRYWRHLKNTSIFPDPAGSYTQHARGETDLDIFRERGYYSIHYRRKHPRQIDRITCVNRMLRRGDGSVGLMVSRKCKHLIQSFEQTIFVEGTREIDKTGGLEHSTDAIGYPIEYLFPLKKVVLAGVSL